MTDAATIDDLIDHALEGYERLLELGEEIDDEWSYVNDLATAWRTRLDDARTERGAAAADAATAAAITAVVDEAGRIEDPHRAIDWLSTFPQVVLTAIGERP